MTNYPRVEQFLKEHPDWSLDQALVWVDAEIKRLGERRGEECTDRNL